MYNKQEFAQELGQSIHDICAKHMRPGDPILVQEFYSIMIAALTPTIGDIVSFIPDSEQRPKAAKEIRMYFGNNLANSVEEYLLK